MFAKLLKYEWRSNARLFSILSVAALGVGVLGAVLLRLMTYMEAALGVSAAGAALSGVLVLGLGFLALALVAYSGAVCILLMVRFYKNKFTDEGYLTFTLPVNNHQILLSSILSSIFGVLLVIVAAAVAVLLSFTLFLLAFPVNVIWADLAVSVENFLAELWASCVKNWNILASVGISGILAGLSQLIMFMLSVTVGAILAKKWKLLAAVAVYYGISILRSFICGIGLIFTAETSKNMMQVFSLYDVVALVTIVGGYFLMYSLMEKKLNLA